jgi:hypothetical protein
VVIEIKSLSSPDVEVDVWQPEPSDGVCFLLEAEIGERGDDRRDLFQIIVATPEGLRTLTPTEPPVLTDRATLVLTEFSWPALHRVLARIVRECAADDWSATVLRLQRYFRWEYEDYTVDGASPAA